MPMGSQEDPQTVPPAVQRLDTEGRDVTVTLHELAREMRLMLEYDDRAGTGNVLSALATRLLSRTSGEDPETG